MTLAYGETPAFRMSLSSKASSWVRLLTGQIFLACHSPSFFSNCIIQYPAAAPGKNELRRKVFPAVPSCQGVQFLSKERDWVQSTTTLNRCEIPFIWSVSVTLRGNNDACGLWSSTSWPFCDPGDSFTANQYSSEPLKVRASSSVTMVSLSDGGDGCREQPVTQSSTVKTNGRNREVFILTAINF
jgi:hypothetical protein